MNDLEKLALLKTLISDADDNILNVYLQLAQDEVLKRLYPFGDGGATIPDKYDMTQIRIAEYLYLRRGSEGEVSHSENGINRSYESADIPLNLVKNIIPLVGIVGDNT